MTLTTPTTKGENDMSTTADQIVSQLDAYAGDNIWEDVAR